MSFIANQGNPYENNRPTTMEAKIADSGDQAIRFTENYINDRLNKQRYVTEKIKA